MIGHQRWTAVLAAALAASTPALATDWPQAEPGEVGMSAERLGRLTERMQAYVDDGDVAGMVVRIARDGQLVYEEAFGVQDLDEGTPMSPDTIFRIASQTKAIVSAGIMLLQEEGRLYVTDPVSDYLPEWADTTVATASGGTEPVARPITIRDLLTHSSGVPYGEWINGTNGEAWGEAGFDGWYLASRDRPIREVVRDMAALPMAGQPGETFLYGYNIDILGAVIEEASGQPLDAFLQDRLFDPMEMTDTHFWLPAEKEDRLATVYDRMGPGTLQPAPEDAGMWTQGDYVEGDGPNLTLSGGAGLLSTAENYATFLEMVRRGGVDIDGDRIMSPMSAQLMTTDHLPEDVAQSPGVGFGYGFAVVTDNGLRGIPGHDGEFRWGGAYHTTYWVDPEVDLVVTAFTQMGETAGLDDQDALRALIYQAILE